MSVRQRISVCITETLLQMNLRVSRVKFHPGTQRCRGRRRNARSVGRGPVRWGLAAGEMTGFEEGTKV